MTWMRHQSLSLLQAAFRAHDAPPGSRLLELGCGTGEEAVSLAQIGYRVLVTDVAPQMVALARAKADRVGVGGQVHGVALAAGRIDALQPSQAFDGAYASFGGLNCEPDLLAMGRALARLVRPGGVFVTSVMGPTCLFEMVWYLLHLRPRRALRRMGGRWQRAPVAGRSGRERAVLTRYLTVKQLTAALSGFVLVRALALPLFLPPPYADSLYRRHADLFRWVERYDRSLRDRQPWRHLGDHTVLVLQRRA